MFDKKYNIDKVYFAKMGKAELVCLDEGVFEKKFYPENYVCVKLVYADKESPVFEDIFDGSIYKFFSSSSRGEYCLAENTFKSVRDIFKNQKFKIINKKIMKKLIEEFNKKPEDRNGKQIALEVCKLNKIKIIKKEEVENQEAL